MKRIEEMTRKEILAGHRMTLYNLIAKNPGITYAALKRATGLIYGSLSWHLGVLITRGMIRSVQVSQYKRYYTMSYKINWNKIFTPLDDIIMQCILDHDGITQADIVRHTGISQSAVSKKLKSLLTDGHIRLEHNGKQIRYYGGNN